MLFDLYEFLGRTFKIVLLDAIFLATCLASSLSSTGRGRGCPLNQFGPPQRLLLPPRNLIRQKNWHKNRNLHNNKFCSKKIHRS